MEKENLKNKNNESKKKGDFTEDNAKFIQCVIDNAPVIKHHIYTVGLNPLLFPLRNYIVETLDSCVMSLSLLQKGYSAQACIILRTFMLSVGKLIFMTFNGSTILNWTNHDIKMQDEVEQRRRLDYFNRFSDVKDKKEFFRRNAFCDFGWAYCDTGRPIFTKYNLYNYVGFDQFGDDFNAELNLITHNDICFKNKYDANDDKRRDFLNKAVRVIAVLYNFLLRCINKLKITSSKILNYASYKCSLNLVPGLDDWWNTKIYDKRVKVDTPDTFK